MSARDVLADAIGIPRWWPDDMRFRRLDAILSALAAAGHVIEGPVSRGGGVMTDENHCKPEPRLRGRFGTHWVVRRDEARGDLTPILVDWEIFNGQGRWAYSEICVESGWRYLAPVTPPATVAALVEALEEAGKFIADYEGMVGQHISVGVSARAALALYREAGR